MRPGVIAEAKNIAFLKEAIAHHPTTNDKSNEQLSLEFIKSLKETVKDIKEQLLEAAKVSFFEAWRYLLQLEKVKDCLSSAENFHYRDAYYQTDRNDYHTNQLKKILAKETELPRVGLIIKDEEVAYAVAESILMDETFFNLNLDVFSFTKKNKIQLLLCLLGMSQNQDEDNFLLRRALNFLGENKSDSLPALESIIHAVNPNLDPNTVDYEALIVALNEDRKDFWKTKDELYNKAQRLLQIYLDCTDLETLHNKVIEESQKLLVLTPKMPGMIRPSVMYDSPLRQGNFAYVTPPPRKQKVIKTSHEMKSFNAELQRRIGELSTYGKSLPELKRLPIAELVKQLKNELTRFNEQVTSDPGSFKHELPLFQTAMVNILGKKQLIDPLYKHRQEGTIWLVNALIALSVVGLVVIIANMVYTANTETKEEHPTFTHLLLFGKARTQQKMDAIREEVIRIAPCV